MSRSVKELNSGAEGALLPIDERFSGEAARPVPTSAVVLALAMRVLSREVLLACYQRLREANRALQFDFFEGVVMDRAESAYPVQLRAATEEFCGWVKHRSVT